MISVLWEYKEERYHVQTTAHVEKNANGVKWACQLMCMYKPSALEPWRVLPLSLYRHTSDRVLPFSTLAAMPTHWPPSPPGWPRTPKACSYWWGWWKPPWSRHYEVKSLAVDSVHFVSFSFYCCLACWLVCIFFQMRYLVLITSIPESLRAGCRCATLVTQINNELV